MPHSAQENPYQTPIQAKRSAHGQLSDRPALLRGSMTIAECYAVNRALQRFSTYASKSFAWAVCGTIMVGGLAFATYVWLFDGLDDFFPSTFVGLGIVLMVPVIVYAERVLQRKKLDELRKKQTGVFSPMNAEVHNTGIYVASVNQPQDAGWDTFCGYRDQGDVIVVFMRFPDEYIALAASCFANPEAWEAARQIVQRELSPIPWRTSKIDRQAKLAASPMGEAMQLFNQSHWRAAVNALDEIINNEPDNVMALRRRAKALMALEPDPAKVLPAVQAAIENGANDTTMLHSRANLLLACEDHELALADYEELVRRDPDDAESRRNRGLTLLKLGKHELAIADCSHVIGQYPGDAVSWNNRGVARLELGQLDDAIIDFKKAISLEPTFPNPQRHLERANALLAERDRQTASV